MNNYKKNYLKKLKKNKQIWKQNQYLIKNMFMVIN